MALIVEGLRCEKRKRRNNGIYKTVNDTNTGNKPK